MQQAFLRILRYLARKNFLFCKTADGAIATGKAFSIVQTARANGLNVELYLKYAIESIDKVPIEDLLPWSKNLPDNLKIIIKKGYVTTNS